MDLDLNLQMTVYESLRDGTARRLREEAHLSQGDCARALGVPRSTFTSWEQGTRLPRRDTALRYGQLLQTLAARAAARRPAASAR